MVHVLWGIADSRRVMHLFPIPLPWKSYKDITRWVLVLVLVVNNHFSHQVSFSLSLSPSLLSFLPSSPHNYRVLSIAASKGQPEENGVAIATEQAWDHVQALYQHSHSTCLFGKNNILVKPVGQLSIQTNQTIITPFSSRQGGFSEPVQGYLTLQQEMAGLILKWIPNTLLKDASNANRYSYNVTLYRCTWQCRLDEGPS